MTSFAAYHSSGLWLRVTCPYSADLVDYMKKTVPSNMRRYDPGDKSWTIYGLDYANLVVDKICSIWPNAVIEGDSEARINARAEQRARWNREQEDRAEEASRRSAEFSGFDSNARSSRWARGGYSSGATNTTTNASWTGTYYYTQAEPETEQQRTEREANEAQQRAYREAAENARREREQREREKRYYEDRQRQAREEQRQQAREEQQRRQQEYDFFNDFFGGRSRYRPGSGDSYGGAASASGNKLTDAYAALGLANNAAPEVVQAAYRVLSKKYHPDLPGGDAQKMKQINGAYDTLKQYGKVGT